MLLVRAEDVDKRPDKVVRIVQSIIEACRFMTANRKASVDLFMKYAGGERVAAEEAYARLMALGAWGVNGGMTEAELVAAMDMAVQNKALDAPIPLAQWADFRFQDEALRRLGGSVAE